MFSLININKLPQFVDPIATDMWLVMDVPDVLNPSGYKTVKILTEDIIPAPVIDTNIGTSDLTVNVSGVRKLILGGSLSSDKFSIRNSIDTLDYFTVNGSGATTVTLGGSLYSDAFTIKGASGLISAVFRGNGWTYLNDKVEHVKQLEFVGPTNTYGYKTNGAQTILNGAGIGGTLLGAVNYYNQWLGIGTQTFSNGRALLAMGLGTVPTTNVANTFQQYAADIVAGNTAPHWRTEDGSVLKLYKNTALTAPDGTLGTAVIRQAEIETILTNLGIL